MSCAPARFASATAQSWTVQPERVDRPARAGRAAAAVRILDRVELVNNINDRGWVEETLPGARGYASMEIVAQEPEYTSAYSCEYVRVPPGGHSVPHIEPYNHLLFFVEGTGEVTIGATTWPLRPGSYAKVPAGEKHSVRNLGADDMLILTVYDPPRPRA